MNDACTDPRQMIADELLNKFTVLAERAHTLAQRTAGKLEPVMRNAEPPGDAKDCAVPEQQYPPLFAEYRDQLYQIQNSLAIIEYCLDRTEI